MDIYLFKYFPLFWKQAYGMQLGLEAAHLVENGNTLEFGRLRHLKRIGTRIRNHLFGRLTRALRYEKGFCGVFKENVASTSLYGLVG